MQNRQFPRIPIDLLLIRWILHYTMVRHHDELMREYVEFNDLIRRLPQESASVNNNMFIWSLIFALSNS